MTPSTPVTPLNPIPLDPASWRDSRRVGLLVLGIAIAALLPAAYRMARPFLTALVLAAILAVALDPLQKRASRLVKRPSVAALLTTLVAVGPVLTVILLAGMAMNREIKSGAFDAILRAAEGLTAGASIDRHAIEQALADLSQVAGGLFTGALAVVFLYVALVYGKGWVSQLAAMLPLDTSVTNRILATIRDAIVANVDGILADERRRGSFVRNRLLDCRHRLARHVGRLRRARIHDSPHRRSSRLAAGYGHIGDSRNLCESGAGRYSVLRRATGGGAVAGSANRRHTAPPAATAHCALGVGRRQRVWRTGHFAGTCHSLRFGGTCARVSEPIAAKHRLTP